MSAQPRNRLYLKHILDAILRIETYLEHIDDRQEFDRTSLVQDAVIRPLQIIGEASKRLSEDLKRSLSAIPWRQVTGMRDKLTHDYMGVDLTLSGKQQSKIWLRSRQPFSSREQGAPTS